MENTTLQTKVKPPFILILFCISTALGFFYNLASVLNLTGPYQIFYACYLIFPIVELLGVFKRSNKILLAGFYGIIVFRIIEYAYAGCTYGFDKLFSLFGTNIAGYFISLLIWWLYFYFSKKSALYFNVNRTTSFIDTHFVSNKLPAISESTISTGTDFVEKFPSDEAISVTSHAHTSKVSVNRFSLKSTYLIIFLLLLITMLGIICIYEYSLYQNALSKINTLSADIDSLKTTNATLSNSVSYLQSENDSLQSQQSDAFMTSVELNSIKNRIRFILDDGTAYYHTYDCPLYQNYSGTYWIHNLEYCEYLGYQPCPLCSSK